jgi:uncharacterized protein
VAERHGTGVLENVLGSAVPAFIVTALVSGKAGVRDLARRSFRWRVPLRWYLINLLAPLLIFLIAVAILYGFAPLRALGQNWLLLLSAFLPALAIMILLNNVAEEIGWTGFVFARFQDRHVGCAPPCCWALQSFTDRQLTPAPMPRPTHVSTVGSP